VRRVPVAASVGVAPILTRLRSTAGAIQNNDFLFKRATPDESNVIAVSAGGKIVADNS